MKTKPARFRLAFALALLALLSTVTICTLGWPRHALRWNQPVPLWVPDSIPRPAYDGGRFGLLLGLHLGAVVLSSIGALWLALRR